MPDPANYRPPPGSIPDRQGGYRFSDAQARVIYVGKAKSLPARLSSYFQDIVTSAPDADDGLERLVGRLDRGDVGG